jgi:hypothetical protein
MLCLALDRQLMFVQETPANAVDPPFTNHAQRQHSFPRPSHPRSRTAPLHLNSSEQALQPSANAVWEPNPEIPSIGSHQYPAHTSNALVPGHLTSDHTHQTNPGGTSWPVVGLGEVVAAPSTFHRLQDEDQPWGVVQTQPDHGSYIHPTTDLFRLNYHAGLQKAIGQEKSRKSPVILRRKTGEVEGVKAERTLARKAKRKDSHYAQIQTYMCAVQVLQVRCKLTRQCTDSKLTSPV